jgi:hypothetical protein
MAYIFEKPYYCEAVLLRNNTAFSFLYLYYLFVLPLRSYQTCLVEELL